MAACAQVEQMEEVGEEQHRPLAREVAARGAQCFVRVIPLLDLEVRAHRRAEVALEGRAAPDEEATRLRRRERGVPAVQREAEARAEAEHRLLGKVLPALASGAEAEHVGERAGAAVERLAVGEAMAAVEAHSVDDASSVGLTSATSRERACRRSIRGGATTDRPACSAGRACASTTCACAPTATWTS